MAAPMEKMRVLELYSGIGGMHCALTASGIEFEVVAAMDVNTNANMVYKHNFPNTTVNSSAIESLTVKAFDSMRIDMLLMSPPCQPFTRVGKQRDTDDVRTKSFLHVLDLLKKSEKSPSFILLENVKGFECSESRKRLLQTLTACDYTYQELLLTPLQFGIPNSRLRYFLIAKKRPSKFCFTISEEVMDRLTEFPSDWFSYRIKATSEKQSDQLKCQGHSCACRASTQSETSTKEYSGNVDCADYSDSRKRINDSDSDQGDCKRKKHEFRQGLVSGELIDCESVAYERSSVQENTKLYAHNQECLQNYGENMRQCVTDEQKSFGPCLKLHHFLEDGFHSPDQFQKYSVAEKDLKRFMVMDIMNPCSQKTCCFTKRYGHYVDGAGSLVQMTTDIESIQDASQLKDKVNKKHLKTDQWEEQQFEIVRRLQLRYFTPREIANILCFPPNFGFPDGLTNRQLYMLLGNSLNVHMVSVLIRVMTKES